MRTANGYVPDDETKKALQLFFGDILTVISKVAPGQSKIRGKSWWNIIFYFDLSSFCISIKMLTVRDLRLSRSYFPGSISKRFHDINDRFNLQCKVNYYKANFYFEIWL